MRHFKPFHHQTIDATNRQGIEDSERTITALFACDQHLSAGHTFRIRESLFDDEKTAQSDGEHRAQQPTKRRDDEGLHPLNGRPDVHNQQSRHSKDDTRC